MKKLFILLVLILPLSAPADEMLFSVDLALDYPGQKQIAVAGDIIFFKYDDWQFSYGQVNQLYPDMRVPDDYIRALFDKSLREKYPDWLKLFTKDQAEVFGIKENNVVHKNIDGCECDLYGVFNSEDNKGYIFIFDTTGKHRIDVKGKKGRFQQILNGIRSR